MPFGDQLREIRDRSKGKPDVAVTMALWRMKELEAERARLHALIHNAHTDDFLEAVRLEAAFQQEKWGAESDAGKSACLNWHRHIMTGASTMRPGIEPPP